MDRKKRTFGFTLIELLVVIAIIVLLIAILIPALSGARSSGYKTQTAALLAGLRANLEEYAVAFGGQYPGPIPEATVAGTAAPKPTGTQNMLLGLAFALQSSGGAPAVQVPGSSPAMYADPTKMNGPVDWGNMVVTSSGTAPRQYNAFFSPQAKDISAPISGTTWDQGGVTITPTPTTPTLWTFPTALDRFPDALPILYFRRTPGVETPVMTANPTAGTAAYYRDSCKDYLDATSMSTPSGTVIYQWHPTDANARAAFHTSNGGTGTTALENVFKGASGNATGGFALIAAGPSRLYGGKAGGSSDSIIVVGGQ